MSHSREINDSATKSATNLQTPQSVHQSKGHGKRFLRLPRGGTLSKPPTNICDFCSHVTLSGLDQIGDFGEVTPKVWPTSQHKWGGSACEHEGGLPSENPAEFLTGFSCRGSTFSQLSPLVSSNPWACAKRMGATIIPEGKIQSHASLQSSENRPQSATAQQKKTHDHMGNWGKYWMIFSNQLTKDRCINHCPNIPKCWSTKN